MSVPNNVIQSQNIVLNQVPFTHAIMTNVNANNGIAVATHTNATNVDQTVNEPKPVMVESIPIANANVIGVPQSNVTVQSSVSSTPSKPALQNSTNISNSILNSDQILPKQRLLDLVREIDITVNLEDEVEEILLSYVDEFVERCISGASLIAKNRDVKTIEVKDVQMFLNRNYNMWTPGFGTDELRPYKRSAMTDAHKQRNAIIRKTVKKN